MNLFLVSHQCTNETRGMHHPFLPWLRNVKVLFTLYRQCADEVICLYCIFSQNVEYKKLKPTYIAITLTKPDISTIHYCKGDESRLLLCITIVLIKLDVYCTFLLTGGYKKLVSRYNVNMLKKLHHPELLTGEAMSLFLGSHQCIYETRCLYHSFLPSGRNKKVLFKLYR